MQHQQENLSQNEQSHSQIQLQSDVGLKKSTTKYNRIQELPSSTKGYKWIPGYEGYYSINQHGKVISYRRRNNRGAVLSDKPQTFIKPWVKTSMKSSKKEFPAVTLYDGIKKSKFYVSRLVAHLFIGYDLNDKTKQIIFKDGNPWNCDVKNLQIGTVSERTLNWIKKKYGKPRRMI